MTKQSINRKPVHPQGSTWQETLQDYKTHMTSKKQQQTQQGAQERDKTTSAYKVKPDSGNPRTLPAITTICPTRGRGGEKVRNPGGQMTAHPHFRVQPRNEIFFWGGF